MIIKQIKLISFLLCILTYTSIFIASNQTLTNNSNYQATKVDFYTANNTALSPTNNTIAPNTSFPIPTNPQNTNLDVTFNYSYPNNNEGSFALPITYNTSLNIFTGSTLTNNSTQTIAVTFYGNKNNGHTNVALSPAITMFAGQSIQIMSGVLDIIVTAGNITVIPEIPINNTTSYFINENNDTGQWNLTTTVPLSSATLTNNYNQSGTNLIFLSDINTQIGTTQATLTSQSSTFIPINATAATITQLNSSLTMPISDTISSTTIFTNAVINNYSQETIQVIFYGTINDTQNSLLNTPAISVLPGQSLPIITGSEKVSVYVDNNIVISQQSLIEDMSYYLYNINNSWILRLYEPTPLTTLTNNYNNDATNLNFYTSSQNILKNEADFSAFNITTIPTTTAYISLQDLNSTLTLPISDVTSSNLFTNYVINNDSNQTIGITFYGTVNGTGNTPLNNPVITTLNYLNTPIPTGAQTFSIVDSNNTLQINQTPIQTNTSYIISPDWTASTAPFIPTLLNNYATDATNVLFYNTNNTQVGTQTETLENQTSITIPTSAVKAVMNDAQTSLTVPVSDTVSSTLYTLYSITNNSSQTIKIIFYGTINGTPNQPLNNPAITIIPNHQVPIITGATTASMYLDTTLIISQTPINPNTNYFINMSNNSWTCNNYASLTTLTNNSAQNASNLIFYNNNNVHITSQFNYPANSSVPIPTTATTASLYELNSTITFPVSGSNFSTVCTNTIITNSTSQTVYINLYGTLNQTPLQLLNNPTITLSAGQSIPLFTGTTNISVFNSSNQQTSINQTNITEGISYFITNTNNNWTLNPYSSSSLLTNNYNQTATNLTFADSNNAQIGTNQQTFQAYSNVAIPSNTTTASFTDFNTTLTIPVISTASSNIFMDQQLYNTSTQTIGITFYGTVNEVADTAFNSQPISIAPGQAFPLLTNTTSLTITVNNNIVIDTSTLFDPLPLNVSYNIAFNNNSWTIIPETLTLKNNSDETITQIDFYNSTGSLLDSQSFTSIQPWAAIPIPSQATFAVAEYETNTITIPLSTTNSSKIFAKSIVTNNSAQDLYVIFYSSINNIDNIALNEDPILLQPGQWIPFINNTLNITILCNNQIVIDNEPIQSKSSYHITTNTNATLQLTQTSSALNVMRFLEENNTQTSNEITLYGQNPELFTKFLFIDTYAQYITDPTIRATTIATVNTLINNYGTTYNEQKNFNYISYFYMIQDQLLTTKTLLINQYPNATQQLNQFFTSLNKRITTLVH